MAKWSEEALLGAKRLSTVNAVISRFLSLIDWADGAGFGELLHSKIDSRRAYEEYGVWLENRVRRNALNINTAAMYQRTARIELAEIWNDDHFADGVRVIRKSNLAYKSTTVPDELAQGKRLSLCEALFESLTKLVLECKKYPYAVKLPPYLALRDDTLWLFPNAKGFQSPRGRQTSRDGAVYDYSTGQLKSKSATQAGLRAGRATTALQDARDRLRAANGDSKDYRRRWAAMWAHHAFVEMFIAVTGMNWSILRALKWNKNYEIEANAPRFRSIKYRAAGKQVHFTFELAFLSRFKRYLQLREYLLDGAQTDLLFFSMGPCHKGVPRKLGAFSFVSFHETLLRIDSDLPKIRTRGYRAAKADFLIRRYDPSTTALFLQSSEATVLKHYVTGSELQARSELADFLGRLAKSHIWPARRAIPLKGIESAVGACKEFGTPMPETQAAVVPDCKKPEGCLFCEHHVVRNNERDLRKLISCLYCINKLRHLSGAEEHFAQAYGGALERIQFLLEEIGARSKTDCALIRRLRTEVFEEGRLDVYWAHKMETLISLGLVAA